MLRMGLRHGFAAEDWEAAKTQARSIMVERAKKNRPIAYSDLVSRIDAIRLEAHEQRLFHFLGEIGESEDEAGRGILTAVVVHKNGEMKPGPGFFKLAESRGRNVSDIDRCWIEEFNKVVAHWRNDAEPIQARPTTRALERLPISIPHYPGSHPFSRSTNPRFYRYDELGDTAKGDTSRTRFFEEVLVGIYWTLGRAVPYAFETKNGEARSLDAGCVKFLLNRQQPLLELVCDPNGVIAAVKPTEVLLTTYRESRDKLLVRVNPDGPLLPLDFDFVSPVDERRKALSEQVIRDGATAFRASVLSAWGTQCAITKTKIEPVLDAAHIYRYLGPKTNDVRNGIPLRADIHRLFDRLLLTLVVNDAGARVMLSKALRTSIYRNLEQVTVSFPIAQAMRPDNRVLEHHAEEFMKAEAVRL